MRRKENKNNSYLNNKINILCFFTLLLTIFLTVGFSSFSSTLNLNGLSAYVMAQADIRVTNVGVTDTQNGGVSNWEKFNVNNITSSVTLPNSNSTVTFQIEVTNIGNTLEGIYDIDEIYNITGTNTASNLEIKSKTVALKEALCDDTINNKCTLGSVTTFTITVGYASGGYDGTNQDHTIRLDFDFRRVYEITYIGFTNITGLPTQMIYGDTKTVTFTSTTSIPSNVLVSGATGNYVSPNLTLSNITISNINETIEVTKVYSVTYSGFTGSTSSLPSYMLPTGGTITFTSTSGIPSSVSVSGATGSYSSPTLTVSNVTGNITVTGSFGPSGSGTPEDPYVEPGPTQYDYHDVDPGTTVVFPNVPGVPLATADSNGNIVSFEYTDISSDNPVILQSGDSVDTGIIGLNGEKFTIHIIFKANLDDNNGKFMVSALEMNNNNFSGISIFDYNSGYVRTGVYKDRARSGTTGLLNPNTYCTGNSTAIHGTNTFDVTVTYNPQGYQGQYAQVDMSMTANGTTKTGFVRNTAITTNIPQTLTNSIITLGGNGLDSTDNMNYFEVIAFSVTKG